MRTRAGRPGSTGRKAAWSPGVPTAEAAAVRTQSDGAPGGRRGRARERCRASGRLRRRAVILVLKRRAEGRRSSLNSRGAASADCWASAPAKGTNARKAPLARDRRVALAQAAGAAGDRARATAPAHRDEPPRANRLRVVRGWSGMAGGGSLARAEPGPTASVSPRRVEYPAARVEVVLMRRPASSPRLCSGTAERTTNGCARCL